MSEGAPTAGSGLRTPVALLIFNRPETTTRVFEQVRQARPERLLVVADGPRANVEGEDERCARARAATEVVDWPCEVTRDYTDANLGCKRRVSSGISWVFDEVEEAILLEDDCLPHPSFFPFCEELLDRYRDDERVMHISGDNLGFGRRGDASYFFSRYPHIWGWASWRRAWRRYDPDLREWVMSSDPDRSEVLSRFADADERRFWYRVWDESASGEIDTWDYQWVFACIANGGLAINPNVNLVTNVGFGEDSRHTSSDGEGLSELPAVDVELPLQHPSVIERDAECDAETARRFFSDPEPSPEPETPRFRERAGRWLSSLR